MIARRATVRALSDFRRGLPATNRRSNRHGAIGAEATIHSIGDLTSRDLIFPIGRIAVSALRSIGRQWGHATRRGIVND